MFKGLNITCVMYILALYFYHGGGLRVFNHFLRLISFLFCYFLIFLWIFSLAIFLNFFLNFLKKPASVPYKIFLIKKKSVRYHTFSYNYSSSSSYIPLTPPPTLSSTFSLPSPPLPLPSPPLPSCLLIL